MAKLPNYNLLYLTNYKDIFEYILNDNNIKKECVKSCIDDEINKLNNENYILDEYKNINIGTFDYLIICDDEIKSFLYDFNGLFLTEEKYIGIEKNQIKNIIDSKNINLLIYKFNENFDKFNLLELDSFLNDYSYVNDCKYKIIAKTNYNL